MSLDFHKSFAKSEQFETTTMCMKLVLYTNCTPFFLSHFQEVEPMYREADHVHISALTSLLGVAVRVQYMDRGEGKNVNHHDFPEGEHPTVHLLYRPGHYDILYL